jgi:hypothetical protein
MNVLKTSRVEGRRKRPLPSQIFSGEISMTKHDDLSSSAMTVAKITESYRLFFKNDVDYCS